MANNKKAFGRPSNVKSTSSSKKNNNKKSEYGKAFGPPDKRLSTKEYYYQMSRQDPHKYWQNVRSTDHRFDKGKYYDGYWDMLSRTDPHKYWESANPRSHLSTQEWIKQNGYNQQETHHNGRNILDRIFGPLMNNTAAQVAYAHATGDSKSKAAVDSIRYMLPTTNDVSNRKYWSDVFKYNEDKLAKQGKETVYSTTPLSELRTTVNGKMFDERKGQKIDFGKAAFSSTPFSEVKEIHPEIENDKAALNRFNTAFTGLLFDIGTDPLTFLGSGIAGGASKIIKGTGRTRQEIKAAEKYAQYGKRSPEEIEAFREAVKTKEKADSVDRVANAIKHGNEQPGININSRRDNLRLEQIENNFVEKNPILEDHPNATRRMATEAYQNYLHDVYGMVDPDAGRGIGLNNVFELGEHFQEGGKLYNTKRAKVLDRLTREMVSSRRLREIGDKTVAPLFNVANRKLRSTLGTIFSDNAKLFKLAREDGDFKAFNAYFEGDLGKGDFGISNLNIAALRSEVIRNLETGDESALVKWIENASDDELRQFAYDFESGKYKIWAEHADEIQSVRKKANEEADKRLRKSDEAYKDFKEKESQLQTRRELLDKVYQNAKSEMELRGFNRTSDGLERRKVQLELLRKLEKSGDESVIQGIKDIHRQTAFIEKHFDDLSKYDSEIYQVYGKSPVSMDADELISASFLARDLNEIVTLTGKEIDWGEFANIYAELFPDKITNTNALRFRSQINQKLGNGKLTNYIKDSIDPDDFAEAVYMYKDKVVSEQIDKLLSGDRLNELYEMPPWEAKKLESPQEKVLWNIIYHMRDVWSEGDILDRLTYKYGKRYMDDYFKARDSILNANAKTGKRAIDPKFVSKEDIERLLDLRRVSDNHPLSDVYDMALKASKSKTKGGYESVQALEKDLKNFEKRYESIKKSDGKLTWKLTDDEKELVDEALYYVKSRKDNFLNYDMNNIAKTLNHDEMVSSIKSLEKDYAEMNEQIGKQVQNEAEEYIRETIGKKYGLNGADVDAMFEMASDESRMEAYRLLAKGFNHILYEEVKLGRMSEEFALKMTNQYLPQMLTDDIIKKWEKVFNEPFSTYERTPGKYDPVHGDKPLFTKGNRFSSYYAGEKKYQRAVRDLSIDELMRDPEITKRFLEDADNWFIQNPRYHEIYKNRANFLDNKEFFVKKYLRESGDDAVEKVIKEKYNEVSQEVGKMFNYNFADLFFNQMVKHNELVQSEFANNIIKGNLMTEFDPKVGKTGDRIVIPYLDILEDCRLIKRYNKKYRKYPSEEIFNTIVEDAGLDHRLVGRNVSHFEVTESQLEQIQEVLKDLRNPDPKAKKTYNIKTKGYNMDNVVYDMVNTYTKTQMKIMQNTFLNLYDSFLTKFKILNTIINVPFHGQNAISNAYQSFLGCGLDAFDPKKLKQAYEIVRNGDPKQMITFGKETRSAAEWRYILNQYNVIDNTFYNDFRMASEAIPEKQMRDISNDQFNNFFGDPFEEGHPLSFLNPLINGLNKPFKAGGRAGAAIEGTQRANLFFSLVGQGHDYRTAANMVDDFLFDYGNLTKEEKTWFRRIIPFYSFLRKNVPMELANMLEQPQKYANTRRLFDSVSRLSEDYIPPDERHEMRDTDIQLPFRVNGEYYGLADNLPYSQFEKWDDPGKALGQTSPLIKLLPELLTGKYAYTGMDFEGDTPAEQALFYAMNQVPITKMAARHITDQNFGIAPTDADSDYEPDTTRGVMWDIGQALGFPINRIRRQNYYGEDIYQQYADEPGVIEDLLDMMKQRSISKVRNKE